DAAALLAQVRRQGRRAELALEGGRQHVLAGVLLHVVEAPCPVHLGGELDARRVAGAAVEHVPDPPLAVGLDVHPRGVAEPRAMCSRSTSASDQLSRDEPASGRAASAAGAVRRGSRRGARNTAGRSLAPMRAPSETATACSMAFSSSRTFPG